MGGFMPTPAAPAQPPPVKLDTTATSRGNFNEFLRNMNGAMNPPLAPMVGAAAPTLAPTMSDIDIFNPPVQNFEIGGFAGDTSGTFSVDDDTGQTSDTFDFFSGSDNESSSVLSGDDDQAISDLIAAGTNVVPQNIFADDAQASVGTNVGLEKSGGFSAGVQKDVPGRFTAFRSPSFAMRGLARDFRSKIRDAGDDGLTVSNYFNTFNPSDDNKDRLEEFKSLTGKSGSDKLNLNDMNNIMNIQAKYEAGIRNVAPSVQKAILSTVDIDDDRKVEDILGDLDLGINLAGNRDDIRSIEANPVFSPSMAGLPLVKSTRSTVADDKINALNSLIGSGSPKAPTISEQLQENVRQQQLAQRGRALGPIQFGDDLANFQERLEPFESSRVGDDFDTALDMQDIAEKNRLRDELLTKGEIAQNFRDRDYRIPSNMSLNDLIAATTPGTSLYDKTMAGDFSMFKGDPFFGNSLMERNLQDGTVTTSTRRDGLSEGEIDQDESIRTMSPGESRARFGGGLGEIVSGLEDGFQKDIVELANRKPSINVSGIFGKALNLPETFTRDRMVDTLTTNRGKRLFGGTYEPKPIYQDGKIVGIKDQYGNLMEGIDPFAPDTGSNENEDPIIRPIIPIKKKEEEVKDKPPNIIGGMPIASDPPLPTVVDSPFAPATSKIEPVTFDSGDLNKLIEMLTGVSAKPVVSAAEGGLIRAVDDFLATGR